MGNIRGRGPFLHAAAFLLASLAGYLLLWPKPMTTESYRNETARRYEAFWQGLERDADSSRSRVEDWLKDDTAQEARFEALALAARESKLPVFSPRPTFLLFNPDGDAAAWAGEGLQHEPAPSSGEEGRFFTRGVTATTLWVQRTLPVEKRSWKLIVGVSFPDSELVFSPRPLASAVRWSVARAEKGEDGSGLEIKAIGGGPVISIESLRFADRGWLGELWIISLLISILLIRFAVDRGARLPSFLPNFGGSAFFLLLAFFGFLIQHVGLVAVGDEPPTWGWPFFAALLHGVGPLLVALCSPLAPSTA